MDPKVWLFISMQLFWAALWLACSVAQQPSYLQYAKITKTTKFHENETKKTCYLVKIVRILSLEKPCYFENRVVWEPCKPKTACTLKWYWLKIWIEVQAENPIVTSRWCQQQQYLHAEDTTTAILKPQWGKLFFWICNSFFHYLKHSVYINIVPHKALTSVLISKSLAELAAEGSCRPKIGWCLIK